VERSDVFLNCVEARLCLADVGGSGEIYIEVGHPWAGGGSF